MGRPGEAAGGEELRPLLEVDFQLAFLCRLTEQGLKPVSRWEKSVPDPVLEAMRRRGLRATRVNRTVLTGRTVVETLFSVHETLLEIYNERFDGQPVDKGPAAQRVEGLLFGFPGCCVEAFIHQPYAPNDLEPGDRRILFHWACNGCPSTHLLLPRYRRIHDELDGVARGMGLPGSPAVL